MSRVLTPRVELTRRRRAARLVGIAALCAAVAACGFRLQGAPELPAFFARTHVVAADPYSPLVRELARALDGTAAEIVDEAAGASAVLRIREDRTEQRVLSVSVQGQPREYEIIYSVRFEVQVTGGMTFPMQSLEVRRDYPFDETDVLGRTREAQDLTEAMRRDMANLIVRRLAALRVATP